MKLNMHALALTICGMLLLNGCGAPVSSDSEPEMIYVKSVSLYDTITDIYADPDAYLGKQYHMTGTLYPSTNDNGNTSTVKTDDINKRIYNKNISAPRGAAFVLQLGINVISIYHSSMLQCSGRWKTADADK